jgi:hypothetical protein
MQSRSHTASTLSRHSEPRQSCAAGYKFTALAEFDGVVPKSKLGRFRSSERALSTNKIRQYHYHQKTQLAFFSNFQ